MWFFKTHTPFEICPVTIQTVNWYLPSGYSVTLINYAMRQSMQTDTMWLYKTHIPFEIRPATIQTVNCQVAIQLLW